MDPLALLSDGEGSSDDLESGTAVSPKAAEQKTPVDGALPSKRRRLDSTSVASGSIGIGFQDLQNAGYKPAELLESNPGPRKREGRVDKTLGSDVPSSRAQPSSWVDFDDPRLSPKMRDTLQAAGFKAPTPIQAAAWPWLFAGRDVIGISQTGSGKTLAYLVPCISRIESNSSSEADGSVEDALVLILTPTRELACQIEREAAPFSKAVAAPLATLHGGVPRGIQIEELSRRPQLLIATPGRLHDLLQTVPAFCSIGGVRCLVLDEADRMLDIGFEEQMRSILSLASFPQRQTSMFSATWPEAASNIAADYLIDSVPVNVGDASKGLCVNASIQQEVILLANDAEKLRALITELNRVSHMKAIVFVATKLGCHDLERSIRGSLHAITAVIHGDRKQRDRELALQGFRSGGVRVLFATDLASRGLDISQVELVVNYDPPRNADDYVHRIGRVSRRAGDEGRAITLLTPGDEAAVPYILEVMKTRQAAATNAAIHSAKRTVKTLINKKPCRTK